MSLITDCFTLPAYQESDCSELKKGGNPAYAIISPDANIADYTDDTDWQTAIDAGLVQVVKGHIKVDIPAAAPIEIENTDPCGPENVVDLLDHTINITDWSVSAENDEFYAKLNKLKGQLIAVYNCDSEEVLIYDQAAVFKTTGAINPRSNRERQNYTLTAMVTGAADWYPTRVAAPAGIFTN